jgi:heme exporter protein D
MLGVKDPCVWAAYALCLLSTLSCIVYGLLSRHRGGCAVAGDKAPLGGDGNES